MLSNESRSNHLQQPLTQLLPQVRICSRCTITFKANAVGDIFGTSDGAEVTSYGSLKLDSTANTPIKIDLGEVTTAANHKRLHGFLEANVGAADYDVNEPQLSASGGTSMAGLSVGTASGSTQALATIDRAIDAVNANRGVLGALQNRLEHNQQPVIDLERNKGAKGRILDADFAKETSELTKHQIYTGRHQHAGSGQPVKAGYPGSPAGLRNQLIASMAEQKTSSPN